MNDRNHWAIIEKARSEKNDIDEFIESLESEISILNAEQLIEFKRFIETKIVALYRWDVWGIAYIVNGGCSDDGFEYFRRWVITQGHVFYQQLLTDPDGTFTDAEVTDCECEELTYIVDEMYESVSGNDMPPNNIRDPGEPLGERWDEEELEELFPKTAAIYE